MHGGFQQDPVHIRSLAPRFEEAGQTLLRAVQAAQTELVRLGRPWGQDETGNGFEETYRPSSNRLLPAFDALARALAGIGAVSERMADNLQGAEDRLEQVMDGVHRPSARRH